MSTPLSSMFWITNHQCFTVSVGHATKTFYNKLISASD